MSQFWPQQGAVGYVHRPWGIVYFGFVAGQSLGPADVTALDSSNANQVNGSFQLTQDPGPGYPCIAFPVFFQVPSTFLVGAVPLTMNHSALTINGVAYNVYVGNVTSSATTLNITVS